MIPPTHNPASRRSRPRRKTAHRLIFSEVAPSRIEIVEPLVARTMEALSRCGCVDGQGTAAELSLREALANAILHGNKSRPEKRVELDCFQKDDGSILLVVRDEGAGFDPSQVSDPTQPENIFRAGGRGIYLIQHFMDEVEYRQGGREVRMRKKK